jgi:hypothetical protein
MGDLVNKNSYVKSKKKKGQIDKLFPITSKQRWEYSARVVMSLQHILGVDHILKK